MRGIGLLKVGAVALLTLAACTEGSSPGTREGTSGTSPAATATTAPVVAPAEAATAIPGPATPIATPEGPTPTPRPTVTPHAPIPVEHASFRLHTEGASVLEEMLRAVPDSPNTRTMVWINDYAAARALFGIELPDLEAEQSEVNRYLIRLAQAHMARGPRISGFDFHGTSFSTYPFMALGLRNADQSVMAGEFPMVLEAVTGRFDPKLTASTLARCAECPRPAVSTHGGVEFYSWGEDFEADRDRRLTPPAFDDSGHGGRIAVQDTVVLRALYTEGLHTLIDAGRGTAASLADVDEYSLVARGLAGLGAYSVLISGDIFAVEETLAALVDRGPPPGVRWTEETVRAALTGSELLVPFDLVGSGWGIDEQGRTFTAIALVHADAQAAERNVERLISRIQSGVTPLGEKPWTELVWRAEVATDGRVLLAKLFSSFGVIQQRGLEPLTVHE